MSSDDRRARRGRSRSRSRSPPQHHRQIDRHRRSRSGSRSNPDRRRHRDRSYSPRDRRSRPRTEDYRHRSSYEDRHREHRHGSGSEGRHHRYQEALNTGLDQDLDTQPYPTEEKKRRRSPARSDRPLPPCQFICISGLPRDAEEEALQALFAPIPGIKSLKLNKADKDEERAVTCDGTAMLEMVSVPAAVAVMESEWREGAYFKEKRLLLEYTRPPLPPKGIKDSTDWICQACKFVNFAQRSECKQCSAPRTAECKPFYREEPSHVLRISNLEPQMDEQALEFMLKPHAPLKFVRLACDKVTGESKCVAFAYFYSTKDATAVRKALEDAQKKSQNSKLIIAYATDRRGVAEEDLEALTTGNGGESGSEGVSPSSFKEKRRRRGRTARSKAENAFEVAGWEPKAFDEAAMEIEDEEQHGADAAGTVNSKFNFEFDAATGYMKDIASGYLYDANTGFYFQPSLQQWGNRNAMTGEFVPYDAQHAQQQGGASTAAETAVAATNAAIASKKAAAVAVVAAAEATAPAKQQGSSSGPVIGAAPQLNPEALRIAAEEKAKAQQEQQANAPVQGVVHRGKWAQRKAAQQQQ